MSTSIKNHEGIHSHILYYTAHTLSIRFNPFVRECIVVALDQIIPQGMGLGRPRMPTWICPNRHRVWMQTAAPPRRVPEQGDGRLWYATDTDRHIAYETSGAYHQLLIEV
jgi:hypothetical protein